MTTEQFREATRAHPFRPFTVHLADGRSYSVAHPDFAMAGPHNRTAYIWRPDGRTGELIDVLLVVGLEYQAPAESGTSTF